MMFISDRTIIRFPKEEDAKDIFNNYTKDSEVTKYLVWKPHSSLQQTIEWINFCISYCNNESGLKFIIYHKQDKQAIGMIDFRFNGFQSDFGYVLAKKYWNQGIMTEAMKPVLQYVYEMPSIYRIWATHDIDNDASGKVMLKLGLEYEGTLRRAFIHPNVSDKPRDGKLYSLVK
ncbi:MAG: GNAT family N-acetyltransferase [Desulfatirhabdiaceae bacterium]